MKKEKRILEGLVWIPTIIMVVIIFVLSSQSGEDSKQTSGTLAMIVADKTRLEVDYKDINNLQNFDALNQIIRTLAHMTEYAVFALCVGFAVSVNGFRGKMRLIYMCLFGILLSFCDEFYQIFVPGRYGDLIDMLFDCVSVLGISILVYFVGMLATKLRKKKHEEIEKTQEIDTDLRRKFMASYIDSVTLQQVLNLFEKWTEHRDKFHYIVTPNVDHMVKLENDKEFQKLYENADLILTDGAPLMWIAESLGNPLKQRIPGSDLLPYVCSMAKNNRKSIYILGGQEGVAKQAAENLRRDYPGLQIAGYYSPDMNIEKDEVQQKKIVKRINESQADILVVALGAPKQEKFIYKYRSQLKVSLGLPIGAAVDFAAGNVRRAPKWMRKSGLEWLYRFIQEPGRLFRRYFIDDMKIFWLAWKYRHQIEGEK